jgi:hypothetical protein
MIRICTTPYGSRNFFFFCAKRTTQHATRKTQSAALKAQRTKNRWAAAIFWHGKL